MDLPKRLGVRIAPAFQTFVLVGPDARIDRSRSFNTSRVVKADQLKKAIGRDIDSENGLVGLVRFAAKIVSGETVEFVARQLAKMHRPRFPLTAGTGPSPNDAAMKSVRPALRSPGRIEPTLATELPPSSPDQGSGPRCK